MIHWKYLGLTPYLDSLAIQERLRQKIAEKPTDAWILLLEHPPVITGGKRSQPDDLLVDRAFLADRGIGYHQIHRGGQLTYHGPGQLIVYFLLHLKTYRLRVPDLIEAITGSVIDMLADYRIEAHYKQDRPGVWIDDNKIASIGLGLNKGITSHGLALNIDCDLEPFNWIVPCGQPNTVYTTMKVNAQHDIGPLDSVAREYIQCFDEFARLGQMRESENLS